MTSLFKSTYLANPRLKKAGVKLDFTAEQIQEILKCSKDPIYFINNYLKIVNLDAGLIQCQLRPYQEKMIRNFNDNRFSIMLCPRQIGKTISYVGYVLWLSIFKDSQNIVVLANRNKTAKEILYRVKLAYENLPKWIQQGVIEWNKSSIELENGSKISSDSTSGSTGRSGSINCLVLDEFAHVHNNVSDDFMKSVYPTITAGTTTKIIIVSTPKGVNLFYKLWTEAEKKQNRYVPFTMHWSEVPGRDDKWRDETIRNIGAEAFDQEYGCSFFGSVSNTLIASSKLKNLVFQQPTYSQECLDVYEKPQPKHTYVACVDVARGDANDFSVMSIIDVTQLPFKFVAKYRSNKIPPLIFPNVIAEIGQKYNNAWLLIETNDAGSQVADALKYELEYENLIYTVKNTRLSTQEMSFSQGKIGVMTTKKTKNIGCVNLKTLIENDQLIVTDFDTISEMTTFVSKLGSFAGDSGTNDDLVMTLVLFGWLSNQKNFKDLTNSNIRESLVANQQEVFKDIPFVIVDDHQSNLNQMEVLEPGDLYIVSESAWLFPQDKER
jgi:hypothetical protein